MYVPALFVRGRYGKSKKMLRLSIHRQMILKISDIQIYTKSLEKTNKKGQMSS